MLSMMRKQAGSWMIKLVLFAIVVVFVFWGVGSYTNRQANKVAEVNDEVITYTTYQQSYNRMLEQYRRVYGSALNNEMLQGLNLKEQALNQLIDQVLMSQEAERLNLQIAEKTLDEAVLKIPAFQNNGVFDERRANFILAQNGMTSAEFRNSLRQDMLISQLRALVTDGATVSEEEAREWHAWYNAEVNLDYVVFSPERYEDIEVAEADVDEYYQQHKERYKTALQVKVTYLHFDPDAYKAGVHVSDEEISQYYYDHPEAFKSEKTVEARHILFKLDADADAETVASQQKKAMEIYKLATSGQPFDQLAKQHSEGPTRDNGGYLGAFKKDAMVKPFADKAFAMKVGEISEPVRTRFGWHLIKVEKINPARTESLQQATEGIRRKLVEVKALEMARLKAESIYDAVYDGDDLAAAAQQHEVPVFQTGFFGSEGPRQKDIGDVPKFAKTALALKEMDISEVQDFGNGYYLLQVTQRKNPEIPQLEKVAERVKADTVKARQDDRAKADAEKCLTELKGGADIVASAAEFGLKVEETGFFKRNGAIPKIGYESALSQTAFTLKPDQALPEDVFKGKEGWYVVRYKDRKLPADEDFEKEKSALMKRLIEQKRQSTFQQWLADLRANGRIDIKRDAIR